MNPLSMKTTVCSVSVDFDKDDQVFTIPVEGSYVYIEAIEGVNREKTRIEKVIYLVHLRLLTESHEDAAKEGRVHGRSANRFHVRKYRQWEDLPGIGEKFLFFERMCYFYGWVEFSSDEPQQSACGASSPP